MSILTKVLKLFCYDPETDGANTFNIPKALNENWEKIDQLVLLAVAAAAAYDPEDSYAVGDYCTHGGKLHKCNTAIPSGEAWNPEHWVETTVAAELGSKAFSIPLNIPDNDCNNITMFGVYRVSGSTINAFQGNLGGIILNLPWDQNRQQQIAVNPSGTTLAHRYKNGGIWGGWIPIADATPPQEFGLPLAPEIYTVQSCTYRKNQFGEVTVTGTVGGSLSSGQLIAALPAQYRPAIQTEKPATFAKVAGDYYGGSVLIYPDGNVNIYLSQGLTVDIAIFDASFVAAG